MSLFSLPDKDGKKEDLRILGKLKKPKITSTKKIKGSLIDLIATAEIEVNRYFAKFKNDFLIIRDEETLKQYIDTVIKDGIVAIDTETNGLDTISGICAGICLYSPSNKAAYIPLHHISYMTGTELKNQLSHNIIKKYFSQLGNVKIIMHNASFDIEVLQNLVGIKVKCYWDTMIAANLLNENEKHSLKYLHDKYCGDGTGVYSITNLFEGLVFTQVPINLGYLYAARDAKMTYELYKYQTRYLSDNPEKGYEDLKSCYDVMMNIEMPLIDAIVEAETYGIGLSAETTEKLRAEYLNKYIELETSLQNMISNIETEIKDYIRRKSHFGKAVKDMAKLQYPVNFGSPVQVKELLYDVLRVKYKGNNQSTGEEELKEIKNLNSDNTFVCKLIDTLLEYRGISKLFSTYIEALPASINKKTGKIHARFNQYGAKTGRMSSSNPNLQNIPSHNKDIRKMFKGDDSKTLYDTDNKLSLYPFDIINTDKGYIRADSLKKDDIVLDDSQNKHTIADISKEGLNIILCLK